jgi:translation initiation factor 1
MAQKKTNNLSSLGGLVYSTDPNFKIGSDETPQETLAPAQQMLRIKLEAKHRAGKTVTAIYGFVGTEADLEKLSKQLKTQCGTGGSAKEGEIIIQGDHREKILQWLIKNGFSKTKRMG